MMVSSRHHYKDSVKKLFVFHFIRGQKECGQDIIGAYSYLCLVFSGITTRKRSSDLELRSDAAEHRRVRSPYHPPVCTPNQNGSHSAPVSRAGSERTMSHLLNLSRKNTRTYALHKNQIRK